MTRGTKTRMTMKQRRGQPGPGATQYAGPILLGTGDGAAKDVIMVNLSTIYEMSTDSLGEMKGALSTADVTGCSDFTQYSGAYRECRVVGMEIKYHNRYDKSGALRVPGTGLMAVCHSTPVPTPVNKDEVAQYASHKLFDSGTPARIHWRMSSVEEAQFDRTSSPNSHGGLLWFLETGEASVNQGTFVVTYLVQFRNRY